MSDHEHTENGDCCDHPMSYAADHEVIQCRPYDPEADHPKSEAGFYTLMKPNFHTHTIDVAICSPAHEILKTFRGRTVQEIYSAIFEYEESNGLQWVESKSHAAYLGKELKKVEIALALGNAAYFQE